VESSEMAEAQILTPDDNIPTTPSRCQMGMSYQDAIENFIEKSQQILPNQI